MPAAALCCLGTHKAPPGRPAPALLRLSGDLCALHGASNAVGCCGRRKRLHQGRSGVQDVRERTQSALFLMRRVERRNPSVHQCAVAAWRHMRPPARRPCSGSPVRRSVPATGACTAWSALPARASRCPLLFTRDTRQLPAALLGEGPQRKPGGPALLGGQRDRLIESNGGPSSSAGEGRRFRRQRRRSGAT